MNDSLQSIDTKRVQNTAKEPSKKMVTKVTRNITAATAILVLS